MAESKDRTARDARAAAELAPDVDADAIGEVYGKALLGAARAAGRADTVLEELDAVVSGVLAEHPRLAAVLASPLISHEDKSGVLERLFGPRISPLLLHFLQVVSRHGRLGALRAIYGQARRLDEQASGRVRVRLTSATSLDQPQLDRIAGQLRGLLGREPVLEVVVDPDLIGGVVLRVEDTVYDGSLANQLERLRQQMIERSVHEIQSRRDRFRYPAGS
jgi:F-type H+-transporting ATPase subunit delta